jgi:hypothetical protein
MDTDFDLSCITPPSEEYVFDCVLNDEHDTIGMEYIKYNFFLGQIANGVYDINAILEYCRNGSITLNHLRNMLSIIDYVRAVDAGPRYVLRMEVFRDLIAHPEFPLGEFFAAIYMDKALHLYLDHVVGRNVAYEYFLSVIRETFLKRGDQFNRDSLETIVAIIDRRSSILTESPVERVRDISCGPHIQSYLVMDRERVSAHTIRTYRRNVRDVWSHLTALFPALTRESLNNPSTIASLSSTEVLSEHYDPVSLVSAYIDAENVYYQEMHKYLIDKDGILCRRAAFTFVNIMTFVQLGDLKASPNGVDTLQLTNALSELQMFHSDIVLFKEMYPAHRGEFDVLSDFMKKRALYFKVYYELLNESPEPACVKAFMIKYPTRCERLPYCVLFDFVFHHCDLEHVTMKDITTFKKCRVLLGGFTQERTMLNEQECKASFSVEYMQYINRICMLSFHIHSLVDQFETMLEKEQIHYLPSEGKFYKFELASDVVYDSFHRQITRMDGSSCCIRLTDVLAREPEMNVAEQLPSIFVDVLTLKGVEAHRIFDECKQGGIDVNIGKSVLVQIADFYYRRISQNPDDFEIGGLFKCIKEKRPLLAYFRDTMTYNPAYLKREYSRKDPFTAYVADVMMTYCHRRIDIFYRVIVALQRAIPEIVDVMFSSAKDNVAASIRHDWTIAVTKYVEKYTRNELSASQPIDVQSCERSKMVRAITDELLKSGNIAFVHRANECKYHLMFDLENNPCRFAFQLVCTCLNQTRQPLRHGDSVATFFDDKIDCSMCRQSLLVMMYFLYEMENLL